MVKDRAGYRASVKAAHGSDAVEHSIGITALRSPIAPVASRPIGLMKWSFDDYVVEEQLPEALQLQTRLARVDDGRGDGDGPSGSCGGDETTLLVRVLSEGVPDTVVERLVQQRCPVRVAAHFLTPIDFVSCTERYVWICGDSPALRASFADPQLLYTPHGEVRMSPAQCIPVSPKAPFPLHLLPDLRYTVVMRNLGGSLSDVLPRLQTISSAGVLNYHHIARHGLSALRGYEDGKRIIQRDLVPVVQHYAQSLSEGTRAVRQEMPTLLETLADPRSRRKEWEGVVTGMAAALSEDRDVMLRPQTGLYSPHHALLADFVRRAADLCPVHHDSAQLLREAVHPLVLREKIHCASEVAFNALASLRWDLYADRVVVGDLVAVADGSAGASTAPPLRDVFEGAADHVNGTRTSDAHRDWVFASDAAVAESHQQVRVVRTEADASLYTIDQVVLPFHGKGVDLLPVLPENRCGQMFQRLAHELQMEGISQMHMAPLASYRHLIAKPRDVGFYIFDEKRGWDWAEGDRAAALQGAIYKDQEGIHRLRSPLMLARQKNMIARRGIRGDVQRNFFTKPARMGGMTCAMTFTVPRGTPSTSVLREAFCMATLSPSRLANMMVMMQRK